MCDICLPILGRYARAHEGRPCSLSKSLYCGKCAVHGHSPARCKRVSVTAEILEEAVVQVDVPAGAENFLEVTDTDACVRSLLSVNGITPMVCQDVGKKKQRDFLENKKRLLALAKSKGKTLILVAPPVVKPPKQKSGPLIENATEQDDKA